MSVLLRVEGRGGHASTPARMGPTARLARAITRVDRSPMPTSLPAPTVELFRRLAPHAPLALRPAAGERRPARPGARPGAHRRRARSRAAMVADDVRGHHAAGQPGRST